MDSNNKMSVLDTFLSQRAPQRTILQQPASPTVGPPKALLDGKAEQSHYFNNAEMSRIINVPVSEDMNAEELELFNYHHILGDVYQKGWRLFSTQAQALKEFQEAGGGFFPIGVGWGKCVEADTEILDLQKGRRRVDELGSFMTPSMDEGTGRISPQESTAFASGHKPCVCVLLKSGHKAGLSKDHPVFTDRGWVPAADLKTTDLVATARNLPEPTEYLKISNAKVRVSAYLHADGGCTGLTPTFSNPEEPIINEFKKDVRSLGGSLTEKKQKSKCREFSVPGLRRFRNVLFSTELSRDKRVPANFYLLNKRQTALFLNRFWACDGHVCRT